jgi:hypothetical protein
MSVSEAKITSPNQVELTLTVTLTVGQWAKVAAFLRSHPHLDILELSNAVSETVAPFFQILKHEDNAE